MTVKEKAIDAIRELPPNVDLPGILRELSLLAGVETAQEEIRRGEGMNADEAKARLREWISK